MNQKLFLISGNNCFGTIVLHKPFEVKKNDLFVAISGFRQDGHKYISQAIRKGACAIVAERNGDYQAQAKILVPDSRLSLALLSNKFFDYPSQKLRVIGVTGTNGKTTITYLIKSILELFASVWFLYRNRKREK